MKIVNNSILDFKFYDDGKYHSSLGDIDLGLNIPVIYMNDFENNSLSLRLEYDYFNACLNIIHVFYKSSIGEIIIYEEIFATCHYDISNDNFYLSRNKNEYQINKDLINDILPSFYGGERLEDNLRLQDKIALNKLLSLRKTKNTQLINDKNLFSRKDVYLNYYHILRMLIVMNLDDYIIENVIKSNLTDLLKKYIFSGESELDLNDLVLANKTKDILQLPSFALDFIKNNKEKDKMYSHFRKLNNKLNTNEFKVIVDLLEIVIDCPKMIGAYYDSDELTYFFVFLDNLNKYLEVVNDIPNISSLVRYLGKNFTYYLNLSFVLTDLVDYITMSKYLNLEFENMPKNLSMVHDTIQRDYNLRKDDVLLGEFMKAVNDYSDMTIIGDKYSIITPKDIDDLRNEGKVLSHCVSSYVSRVSSGSSKIFFVRNNDDLGTPLATLELNKYNRLIQLRGKQNASVSKEINDFVSTWVQSLRKDD